MAVKLTSANFEAEAVNSDKPVLIDFYADWCGPCRMMSPVLEEIAAENPQIKVCKVNVDEEGALARQFRVESIPLLVVMKNGKVTASSLGAVPKANVLALLNK